MKITKEYLKKEAFPGNNFSIIFIMSIAIIVFFLTIWLKYNNLSLAIILTLIIVALALFLIITSYKSEKKFKFSNLYVVEDVFINISLKKILDIKPYVHYDRFYTVKFSKNGIYQFQIFSKLEPDDTNTDYITATYSKPGDKYYIAILENKGKRRIIDCFNQKFFTLSDTDFEFVDGKYICK